MENLKIHTTSSPAQLPNLIQLEGALCSMDAIEFKHNLLAYIDHHTTDLMLDLSAVEEVDLGGLNALTIAYRKMQGKGKRLQLVSPQNGALKELMDLTKMGRFLPILI